jgi:hypothetical protein
MLALSSDTCKFRDLVPGREVLVLPVLRGFSLSRGDPVATRGDHSASQPGLANIAVFRSKPG